MTDAGPHEVGQWRTRPAQDEELLALRDLESRQKCAPFFKHKRHSCLVSPAVWGLSLSVECVNSRLMGLVVFCCQPGTVI